MTIIESKLSEMTNKYVSENSMPEDYLNKHSCGLEFGFQDGFKAALSLPEVAELVDWAQEVISAQMRIYGRIPDDSTSNMNVSIYKLNEALKKWTLFTQGEK